jgi:predicted small lipoprotein YifL
MRTIFLPALLVMLLQGCGHTGNLYLPAPQPQPAVAAPAAQQPTAAEEK